MGAAVATVGTGAGIGAGAATVGTIGLPGVWYWPGTGCAIVGIGIG
jgi:hypothetical protein